MTELCHKGLHPRTPQHGRLFERKRATVAGGTRTERSWRCNTCVSARLRDTRADAAEARRIEKATTGAEEEMAYLYEHSIRYEEWRNRAQCRESRHEGFVSTDRAAQREAKLICEDCPVRKECLESALSMPWFEGVAGGESLASNQFAVDPTKGMPHIVGQGKSPLARKQQSE